MAYQATKAAMRAWAASPCDELHLLASEAFHDYENAKAAFKAALEPKKGA